MVGANKILTVSYGTFSCTLEGFDDSFDTMKAIAEYFRDLAADDRYFGAEPPSPDVEMLQRIAEREVQKRVEARVDNNNVLLRASDDSASDAPARPAPEPAPAPAASAPQAPAVTAPVAAPAPAADSAAESVAAKLARIRAVVQTARAVPAATDTPQGYDDDLSPASAAGFDFAEEIADEPVETAAEHIAAADDGVDDSVDDDPLVGEQDDLSPLAETQDDAALEETQEPDDAPAFDTRLEALSELAASEPDFANDDFTEDTIQSDDDDAASDAALLSALSDSLGSDDADAALGDDDTSEDFDDQDEATPIFGADDSADADLELPDIAALDDDTDSETFDDSDTSETDAPEAADGLDPTAFDAAAEDDTLSPLLTDDSGEVAEFDFDDTAFDEPALPEDIAFDDADAGEAGETDDDTGFDMSDHDEEQDELASDALEEDADDETELLLGRPTRKPSEKADALRAAARARARVLTVPRQDDDDAASDEATAPQDEDLSPEDEADLLAQLADSEDSDTPDAAPVEDNSGPEPDEMAVSRLMREADTKLEGPENKRRRSAIAHLKAAVAATVAERRLRPRGAESEAEEAVKSAYRQDLAEVVKSTLPTEPKPKAEKSGDLPPLMLVSEQRVDIPEDRPAASIQPRRVSSSGNLALQADLDDEENANVFSDDGGFAAFAAQAEATQLPDLMEAAIAYIEESGEPGVKRTDAMDLVAEYLGPDEYLREDALRAFGKLLRKGKIEKVSRGIFTISQNSRFI